MSNQDAILDADFVTTGLYILEATTLFESLMIRELTINASMNELFEQDLNFL